MSASTRDKVDVWLEDFFQERLGAKESDELGRLANENDDVAKQVRSTLLVEAALRARGAVPDVAAAVLSQLQQRDRQQEAQVLAAVMSQVRGRARPSASGTGKRKRLAMLSVTATLAVTAALAAVLLSRAVREARRPAPQKSEPLQQEAELGQHPEDHARLSNDSEPPAGVAKGAPEQSGEVPQANIFEFDFEDGELPRFFEQGHVIPSPSNASSQHVVQGTLNPWAPHVSSVLINRPGGLFKFHGELKLRFRYFLTAEAKNLRVQVYDIDQRQNYQWNLPNPVRGAWAYAEAELATFYPVKDQSRRLEPGDRLQNVFVMGGPILGPPLLLDDMILGPAESP